MSDEKQLIIEKTMGLSVMDEEAKKAFKHLEDTLTVSDMEHFRPIVEATNEVAEIMNVKYIAGNENSIQAFKDGKKTYGAFNTKLSKVKKQIKEPYTNTSKAIDVIFNKFKEVYGLAKNHLETEFKPHLDEMAEEKRKKEEAKQAALREEMAQQKEQTNAIIEKSNRDKVFNAIKYDAIAELSSTYLDKLNQLNTDSLEQELAKINNLTVDQVINNANIDDVGLVEYQKLSGDDKDVLHKELSLKKSSLRERYENRLKELVEMQNLRAIQNIDDTAEKHTPPFNNGPEVPKVPELNGTAGEGSQGFDVVFDPDGFIERKQQELATIKEECGYYYENFDKEDKNIAKDIETMLSKALEFINKRLN